MMSNQQVPFQINFKVSKEVLEDRKIRLEFDYSKSKAWKGLTQLFPCKLRLTELVEIVKQVERILQINASRSVKRRKVPCIKFLNDNWDQIEPIINQITLTCKDNEVDDENQNETNCNLPNQVQSCQMDFQIQPVQLQQNTAKTQQGNEVTNENETNCSQPNQTQVNIIEQQQSMQNEFSTQNTFHIKSYNVFDPDSEIALNSRNVEDQDQQLACSITGDFWSDDNDIMKTEFNIPYDDYSYLGDY